VLEGSRLSWGEQGERGTRTPSEPSKTASHTRYTGRRKRALSQTASHTHNTGRGKRALSQTASHTHTIPAEEECALTDSFTHTLYRQRKSALSQTASHAPATPTRGFFVGTWVARAGVPAVLLTDGSVEPLENFFCGVREPKQWAQYQPLVHVVTLAVRVKCGSLQMQHWLCLSTSDAITTSLSSPTSAQTGTFSENLPSPFHRPTLHKLSNSNSVVTCKDHAQCQLWPLW